MLLLLLLEWEIRPWHELIREAKLIVAGEVVELDPNAARLKVERVLKGSCPDDVLVLPFKPRNPDRGCDFAITYEKKKYLLCIDDRNYFRVIYHPGRVQLVIRDYGDPAIRFTRAILADDLEELGRLAASGHCLEYVVDYTLLKSRRELRPLLRGLRKGLERSENPDAICEFGLDVTLLPGFIERHPDRPDVVRRVTGRVGSFETWWPTAVRRAFRCRPLRPEWLRDLVGGDVETRAAAREAILDCGPHAIEGDDPEIVSLREEMELLADIRERMRPLAHRAPRPRRSPSSPDAPPCDPPRSAASSRT